MARDEQSIHGLAPNASQPTESGGERSPLVVVPGPDELAAVPDPVPEADAARLRFDAERMRSMLELRSRQLDEAARRESAVLADLRAARAAAREREEEMAETEAEVLARAIRNHHLQQQLQSVLADRTAARETEQGLRADLARAEAELEGALQEADAQRRLANACERQLLETKERLRDANGERRVLAKRAAKLEEFRASRGYRVLRIVWRIKTALLRPFRALRRSVG